MPSGGRNFAFFCSERDHKPQNSGCGYTAQSFHTAWTRTGRQINLLPLDFSRLDNWPPFLDFSLLKAAERFRRLLVARRNLDAEVRQSHAHTWVSEGANNVRRYPSACLWGQRLRAIAPCKIRAVLFRPPLERPAPPQSGSWP